MQNGKFIVVDVDTNQTISSTDTTFHEYIVTGSTYTNFDTSTFRVYNLTRYFKDIAITSKLFFCVDSHVFPLHRRPTHSDVDTIDDGHDSASYLINSAGTTRS